MANGEIAFIQHKDVKYGKNRLKIQFMLHNLFYLHLRTFVKAWKRFGSHAG